MNKWPFRMLAVLLAIGFTAAAAEVALRLLIEAQIPLYEAPVDDSLYFQMRPDIALSFRGVQWKTNRFGLRDSADRRLEKGPGKRLVFLGDSFIFGYAVAQEKTIPSCLERILQRRGRTVEVWNAGVPAYNVEQELAQLTHVVSGFDPDIVLWGIFENDLEPPPYAYNMRSDRTPFHRFFSHSYLLRLVYEKLLVVGWAPPLKNPSKGLSHEKMAAVFRQGREWADRNGVKLLIVVIPGPYQWSRYPHADFLKQSGEAAEIAGLPAVSLLEFLKDRDPTPFLSFDLLHQNEAGSELYAELIADFLVKNSVL